MTLYEQITTTDGVITLKKTDENGQVFWIPLDTANSDYQRYLRWLENPEAEQSPLP